MANNVLKGYSLHVDVENPALRAWNRLQTANNIMQDLGAGAAEAYLNRFTQDEQGHIAILVHSVKLKGHEAVCADVMKSVNRS